MAKFIGDIPSRKNPNRNSGNRPLPTKGIAVGEPNPNGGPMPRRKGPLSQLPSSGRGGGIASRVVPKANRPHLPNTSMSDLDKLSNSVLSKKRRRRKFL